MTDAPERAPGGSTSRSLLNEARLADAAAWERLVTLYAPLVASWCRRWGVLQQDIVDVLQEVFSAVAAHLNRFRKDRPGDTFRGWLMAIARNKTLDHFQRKNREPAAIGGTEASMFFASASSIRGAGVSRPPWCNTSPVIWPCASLVKLICAGNNLLKNFVALSGKISPSCWRVKRARKCSPSRERVKIALGPSW